MYFTGRGSIIIWTGTPLGAAVLKVTGKGKAPRGELKSSFLFGAGYLYPSLQNRE